MIRHGKKKNVAVAAVARELACFIWGHDDRKYQHPPHGRYIRVRLPVKGKMNRCAAPDSHPSPDGKHKQAAASSRLQPAARIKTIEYLSVSVRGCDPCKV